MDSKSIPYSLWAQNTSGPLFARTLAGRACWAGVDLSGRKTIAAVVYVFPPDAQTSLWCILPRFFAPVNSRRPEVHAFLESGSVYLAEGDEIDASAVWACLARDSLLFRIAGIAFDPWLAGDAEERGRRLGIETVPVAQNTEVLSAPTESLLALLLDGLIEHGGDPVLAKMAENLCLARDHRGRPMPSKGSSGGSIAGMSAIIMAMAAAEASLDRATITAAGRSAVPAIRLRAPLGWLARAAVRAGLAEVVA